jgi:hypothetical protein
MGVVFKKLKRQYKTRIFLKFYMHKSLALKISQNLLHSSLYPKFVINVKGIKKKN